MLFMYVCFEILFIVFFVYLFLIHHQLIIRNVLFHTFYFLYFTILVVKWFKSWNIKIELIQISLPVICNSFRKRISLFNSIWSYAYLLIIILKFKTIFVNWKMIFVSSVYIHVYVWILGRLWQVICYLWQILHVFKANAFNLWCLLFNLESLHLKLFNLVCKCFKVRWVIIFDVIVKVAISYGWLTVVL